MVSQCTLGQPVAFQWHSSVHWTSQCTLAQGKGLDKTVPSGTYRVHWQRRFQDFRLARKHPERYLHHSPFATANNALGMSALGKLWHEGSLGNASVLCFQNRSCNFGLIDSIPEQVNLYESARLCSKTSCLILRR